MANELTEMEHELTRLFQESAELNKKINENILLHQELVTRLLNAVQENDRLWRLLINTLVREPDNQED